MSVLRRLFLTIKKEMELNSWKAKNNLGTDTCHKLFLEALPGTLTEILM